MAYLVLFLESLFMRVKHKIKFTRTSCREVTTSIKGPRVVDETTLDLAQGQSSLYWEKYKLFFLSLTVPTGVQRHARETGPCTLQQTLKSKILSCPFNKRCSGGFVKNMTNYEVRTTWSWIKSILFMKSSLACRIEHQRNFSLSHETHKLLLWMRHILFSTEHWNGDANIF